MFSKTSQNSQINTRSSHPEVLCQKKYILKNFVKFPEKHLCCSLFFNEVAGWKLETVRSGHWRCSVEQGALKKKPVLESLFNKVEALGASNFIKEDSDTEDFL